MADERSKGKQIVSKDKKLMEKLSREEFERTIWMIPKDKQKQQILRVFPDFTDDKVEKMLEYIERKRLADPFSLLQDDVIYGGEGGQLLMSSMSPNFEMTLYIAQTTGSFNCH